MSVVAIPELIESPSADSLRVVGVFTDGISLKQLFDIKLQGNLTAEGIRQQLVSQVNASQSQVEVKKVLQVGVAFNLDPPVIVPIPPPAPDPVDTARQNFLNSYELLKIALRKVDAGIIKSDDADLFNLLIQVQKLYISDYLTIE